MPSSSLSPPFPVPQYNIQYNFNAKCQYTARGMFCGAKYTSHIHSSKNNCKLMISSTFHWKSNFTHGSDESLTFSTEILSLHSDRKFHCTESRHKPHLHTGRFTVKKEEKKGGGVRGFCQLSFLGLYHTKAKPVAPFGSWDDPTASVAYNSVLWWFFPQISRARSRTHPYIAQSTPALFKVLVGSENLLLHHDHHLFRAHAWHMQPRYCSQKKTIAYKIKLSCLTDFKKCLKIYK